MLAVRVAGLEAGRASRRALPQPSWAALERIVSPDHELGKRVCLALEGGLAGLCAVPLLTSGQCLWCPRALLYLQELAEELTSVYQPPAPTEGAQEPELEHIQKKRRSRRRKEEETDSDDPARDADFVPSKEVLLQAEEEEGSDAPLSEASEPELEALRGHGGKVSSAGVRVRGLCLGRFLPLAWHEQHKVPELSCGVPTSGRLGQNGPEAGLRDGTAPASRESEREIFGLNCRQRQLRVRVDGDRATGTPGRGCEGLSSCWS